jgi:Putative zinc-finger
MSNLEMRHPEGDLLLPYLDGELPARQARRVRRHVEACWQCRSELDELQKSVGACVRYRRDLLPSLLPPPPAPWSDLKREFDRLDASSEHRRFFQQPVFRWAALAATAVSLIAATLTLRTTVFRPNVEPVKIPRPRPAPDKEFPKVEDSPAGPIARPDGLVPSGPGGLPAALPKPTPPASLADQLQAVAALHQLGADLGEPVEVTREATQVVVSGTGVSPDLQNKIRSALVSVPHVLVRFSEPAPAPVEPVSPDGNNSVPNPRAPATPNRLEAQLGGRTQLESFSSQVLEHNEAAMTRVYALRRLAQQFPAAAETQLSREDLRVLRDLGREHAGVLAREVSAIDRAASPLLLALGGPPPVRPSPGQAATWQAATAELFRSAKQVETLLAALLGAAAPDTPADTLPSQASAAVAQFQADVQQCERLLTQ